MNPLVVDFLKSLLRYALVPVFAWLVQRGIITPDQSETFQIALIMFLITIAWSYYDKWQKRKVLVAALALPAGASPAEAKIASTSDNAPPATLKDDEHARPMRRSEGKDE